jgi:flagellar hook-associated protein 2
MKANVIVDQTDPEAPYRLLLSKEGAGAGNDAEYPEFYFVDGDEDFYIEEERPASNAKIRYQGFDIEVSSNELKDLIPGVALNIKGMSEPGKPIGISIRQDIPKTILKMKDLVTNINNIFSFIQEQNKLDAKSQTIKTLGGDYGIRMSENRLRTIIQQNFAGFMEESPVRVLSDLGVEFNKKGLLTFDEKKFENVLNANFEPTVRLLTGDEFQEGFIPRLGDVLTSMVSSGDGLLSNQRKTYMERVDKLNAEIDNKEKMIEKRADLLKEKLAKIQGAFSNMQSQQNSIAASLGGAAPMPSGPSMGGGKG